MSLPQRLNRTEQQTEDRKYEADGLCDRSPQEIRSEHIVSHAHHGKDAGIDHRDRVQQRCYRRRCDRCRREPVVKRKDSCLGTETDKSEDKCKQKHARVICAINAPSVDKGAGSAEHGRQDDRHKAQGGSADRIGRVFAPRIHTLVPTVMGNQRDRHQCQHLEEQIHSDHICRIADAERHAVCHDKEGKEPVSGFIALHILERVQKNQRPHDRDHQRKHIGHPVQTEIDRKPAGKAIDGHRIAAHKERGCPDAGRRGACHSFTPDPSARHILYGSHQHCKSARERQQYGNQQKQRAQDPSPPAYMINKPIRDQIPGSKFRFHEPFPDLSGLRLRIQGCRQKYFQKGRPAKSSRRE